uniref:Uncharacterized protein n=1 Tax=Aegilops tauschii subsp. strangulata TaxID=200361 RepID=A0A452YWG1_AEGTS
RQRSQLHRFLRFRRSKPNPADSRRTGGSDSGPGRGEEGEMDQVLNKVGSYWFSKRASKEIDSIGDDLNSVSSSIGGGAKWMVNKIKGMQCLFCIS